MLATAEPSSLCDKSNAVYMEAAAAAAAEYSQVRLARLYPVPLSGCYIP